MTPDPTILFQEHIFLPSHFNASVSLFFFPQAFFFPFFLLFSLFNAENLVFLNPVWRGAGGGTSRARSALER